MAYDNKWVLSWFNTQPPDSYALRTREMIAFYLCGDLYMSCAAAYNYGFQRGQNFEKNRVKRKNNRK